MMLAAQIPAYLGQRFAGELLADIHGNLSGYGNGGRVVLCFELRGFQGKEGGHSGENHIRGQWLRFSLGKISQDVFGVFDINIGNI